jgi:glycerophosphoryl diester phosphodiesterase
LPERPPSQPQTDRLILAHDYEDAAERPTLALEEALDHLASAAYAQLDFIVDLKLPGYEGRVVEALERSGLADRAIVSTTYQESLLALKAHHHSVRVGWSVPKARRDYTRSRFMAVPALAVLRVMRRRLPRQAAAALSSGLCHAVMAHWRLVGPELVETVKTAGGELYVWTVDHGPRIQELHSLGVTGVITNDPRLFAALP